MKRILLALFILAACRRETPVTETTAPQTTTQAITATATPAAVAIPQHEAERPAARMAALADIADIPASAPAAKRRAAQSFGAIETNAAPCVKRTVAKRVPNGTTDVRVMLADGKATSVVRVARKGDEWTIDFNAPCPNDKGSISLEFVGSTCACGVDGSGAPVRCPCGIGLAWLKLPVTQAKKVPQ